MRKVIYKEWVRGIETEEAKKKTASERINMQPHHRYEAGTHCYVEKEGMFHGFFPTSLENNDGSFGNFTEALIETTDGMMVNVCPSLIRFVDKPEDEQLAEFAKAAMQGLCGSFISDEADRDEYNYAEMSVMIAKATIAELKKQPK